MTDDKKEEELAYRRFDYNITECKNLIEKIQNKILVMETKQKKDLRNWLWAATAYYPLGGMLNGDCAMVHSAV